MQCNRTNDRCLTILYIENNKNSYFSKTILENYIIFDVNLWDILCNMFTKTQVSILMYLGAVTSENLWLYRAATTLSTEPKTVPQKQYQYLSHPSVFEEKIKHRYIGHWGFS